MESVQLPSGRVVDLTVIHADVKYIMDHYHGRCDEVLAKWHCTLCSSPFRAVQFVLNEVLRKHIIEEPAMALDADGQSGVEIVGKSSLRELFDVSCDRTIVSLKQDVPPKLVTELLEYRSSLDTGWFVNCEG